MDVVLYCSYCNKVGDPDANDETQIVQSPNKPDYYFHPFCLDMVGNGFSYQTSLNKWVKGSITISAPAPASVEKARKPAEFKNGKVVIKPKENK